MAYLLGAGYDIAVAGVYPHASSRTIEDVVGGGFLPLITEHETFRLANDVGYPQSRSAEYGGGTQYFCDSTTKDSGTLGAIQLPNCGLASGNSGGPVLVNGGDLPDAFGDDIVAVVSNASQQCRLLRNVFLPIEQRADSEQRDMAELSSSKP